MLQLTRINGSVLYVNPDHIWLLEATPDTVITMSNGERLVVKEPPDAVVRLFKQYKTEVYSHHNLAG